MSEPAQKLENNAIFKQNSCILNSLFLLFLFRGKSRFPQKIFYNINY